MKPTDQGRYDDYVEYRRRIHQYQYRYRLRSLAYYPACWVLIACFVWTIFQLSMIAYYNHWLIYDFDRYLINPMTWTVVVCLPYVIINRIVPKD